MIGVVVVNHNGLAFTRACLASVYAQDPPPAFVCVVDNASRDGSVAEIRREFRAARVVALSENLGFAGGNNAGLRECLQAGCRQVLVLNNDAALEPGAVQALSARAAHRCVAAPQVVDMDRPQRVTSVAGEFRWEEGKWGRLLRGDGDQTPQRVAAASGCALMLPRPVLERVGMFAEEYFLYYEDVDLMARLRDAGVEVWYEPAATVRHREGGTTGAGALSPLALYYNHRNRLLFMSRHARAETWRRFVLRFAATRIPILLRYAMTGDFARFRAVAAAVRDFRAGRFGRADEWHKDYRTSQCESPSPGPATP